MTAATKHTFKLKYGYATSWTEITLMRSKYVPATPTEDEIQAGEMTESGEWRVSGTSESNLVANIRAIQDAFRMAKAYDDEQVGAYQVWLTFQEDGSEEVWESQVFEGRLELKANALGTAWDGLVEYVTLIWRRMPWWERQIDVPITNENGSNLTSGLKVYNCNDAGSVGSDKYVSYASIAVGVVAGDLPAPALITFAATATDQPDNILVCHNAKTDPTLLSAAELLKEGETGTADTTDANRSGGKTHEYTIPSGSTGLSIEKSSGIFGLGTIFNGAWIRILVSAKFTGTIKITPYMQFNNVHYYGAASLVTGAATTWQLIDLGLIYIPPTKLYASSSFYGFKLGLQLIETAGGTIDVDYIQTWPVDSFAQAVFDEVLVGTADLNAHEGAALCYASLTNSLEMIGVLYGGIYLEPGIAQILLFKWTSDGVDTQKEWTNYLTVKLKCWCRKRNL